jgi:LmbE family N-acetylglucosaminyl deacetylase
MKKPGFLVLLSCFSLFAVAQSPQSWTSAEMYQGIQKLKVLGSVLYIAAHPDDENTRLIAYLSKDKLYRTGYLSMTRGDGGQNLIGDEQGIELGLIRTQELLAARRIDGGEQFFTRAFDFGFSKNPEETFTKWDKEKILSDVVWVIRKFQPDVIITRFPTTGEGGHGHHTASAILANEAFAAAADPARFPEQLKDVKPWQVKRVLWNSFNFGGATPADDKRLRLDVGGYNPLLGKSYGEIAAESRSQHKSQGFGVPAGRGEAFEYFTTTAGNPPANDIMDGVDISWNKITGGQAIRAMIDSLSGAFDFLHPENSVKGLARLYSALNNLPDGYWKQQKLKETRQLIEQCSGLFTDVTAADQFAIQGDSLRINFSFNNRLGVNAVVKNISVDAFDSSLSLALLKNRNQGVIKTVYVPTSKTLTQPYWLEQKMEVGYFNVDNQQKIGQPDVDPAYIATITLNVEGQEIPFTKAIKYKYTDPVKGELYQPVFVIPSSTILSSPSVLVFQKGVKQEKEINVEINANRRINDALEISVRRDDELIRKVDTTGISKNGTRSYSFILGTPRNNAGEVQSLYTYADYAHGRDTVYISRAIRAINYDHIPSIKYFFTDHTKVLNIPLKIYNKKIGYIVGAGDRVPEALEQMGYEVVLLGEKELSRNNLAQFDAIITGVRAYNTNRWMNSYYDKLMKYVNDGGNLIVQYNTSNNIGPVRAKMGPYNFNIVRTRVTDENAEVSFLNPQHPVLNFPNKITANDFKGWVQERSIYHAGGWDTTKFETVISMHDPGESADAGSLVIARYGKGYFSYTGLVFFRELPAGVPGAYRLMANLIALNRKKPF